jgi:hypothetical protein
LEFSYLGKWLAGLGLILAVLGGIFWITGKIPFLGRLPGDIRIEGEHFKFYFPLASCIFLSIIISLILWVISRFK